MTHIEDVLLNSLAQQGDTYVMFVPVDFGDADPDQFDCSGLVQWSCFRAGVRPGVPRASWQQAQFCMTRGTEISVAEALATRGALLFKFPPGTDVPKLKARPESAHVAFSLGDGTTMEAMGRTKPVGIHNADPTKRKWTHGGLIPGVEYAPRPRLEIPEQPTDQPTTDHTNEEEDDMTKILFFKSATDDTVHPYVVVGCVGKHLSPEALNLHHLFKTPTLGADQPLGKEWQDGVALLDGPLRNVA